MYVCAYAWVHVYTVMCTCHTHTTHTYTHTHTNIHTHAHAHTPHYNMFVHMTLIQPNPSQRLDRNNPELFGRISSSKSQLDPQPCEVYFCLICLVLLYMCTCMYPCVVAAFEWAGLWSATKMVCQRHIAKEYLCHNLGKHCLEDTGVTWWLSYPSGGVPFPGCYVSWWLGWLIVAIG